MKIGIDVSDMEKQIWSEETFIGVFRSKGFEVGCLPTFVDYEEYVGLWDKGKNELIRFTDFNGVLWCYPMDATLQVILDYQKSSGRGISRTVYSQAVGRLRKSGCAVDTARQLGAEIIGDPSLEADILVLRTMLEFLAALGYGVSELQVELGDVGWIRSECKQMIYAEEQLIRLLDNRNKDDLIRSGMADIADKHLKFGPWEKMESEVASVLGEESRIRFKQITDAISESGCNVTVDLAATNQHHYYSDLIYRIYSRQEHKLLAQGGRYDGLAGDGIPACGMGLELEAVYGK